MTTPQNLDGYYFRDSDGKVNGPMSKAEFEICRKTGQVTEGMRAWRTAMGMAFKVNIERKFICSTDYMCSGMACNHMWELIMVTFTMSMTAWALCMLDWHDPKAGNAIYLLIFLTILTFVMVIFTIRTVYLRWRKVSTQEFMSEV